MAPQNIGLGAKRDSLEISSERCRRTAAALEREEFVMKAYVIAAETVNDAATFDLYRKEVPATLVPFGGQFVVRGGNLTVLEGEWPHPRLVIIEFPSRAAAEDWYKSAEYRKIISLRLESSTGNLIIVDGFAAQ
jgi:uncharacterized protein (DUF1330 family)